MINVFLPILINVYKVSLKSEALMNFEASLNGHICLSFASEGYIVLNNYIDWFFVDETTEIC